MEQVVHVEVVLEVALIAIARKVIMLEPKEMPSLTVFAIAALLASWPVSLLLRGTGLGPLANIGAETQLFTWPNLR